MYSSDKTTLFNKAIYAIVLSLNKLDDCLSILQVIQKLKLSRSKGLEIKFIRKKVEIKV